MNIVRQRILGIVDTLCRLYLRYSPIALGKGLLWEKVVYAYTNWRPKCRLATTIDGINMRLYLPDLVQGYIYYFGIWEPVITNYMRRILQKGDIFVDVGANVGYYSLMAAQRVGAEGQIHAIEPSPKIFSILSENVRLNHMDNISLHRLATGEVSGQSEIFNGETSANAAATTLRASKGERRNFRSEGMVDVKSLATIVPTDQLLSARLIKIDVEGAEGATIRGFQNLLGQFSDHTEFIIELNEEALLEVGETTANIIRLFDQHGYGAFQLPNTYSVTSYIHRSRPEMVRPYADTGSGQVDILFSQRSLARIAA